MKCEKHGLLEESEIYFIQSHSEWNPSRKACKLCSKASSRRYYKKNRDNINKNAKKYYEKNKEKILKEIKEKRRRAKTDSKKSVKKTK